MAKKQTTDKPRKPCKICNKNLLLTNFYNTDSKLYPDKKIDICKSCLKEIMNEDDINSVKKVLMQIDKPFLTDVWILSKESETDTIGMYFRQINSLPQYKNFTWEHSDFDEEKLEAISSGIEKFDDYDLNELKEKYGFGYPDNEYYLFEKKYNQLSPSFSLITTMHEEYFKEYCINKVKETLAKARGDFKEAKEWANMVKDVADAGKLKPSQMSKADLSAGVDGFGQLARAVEEKYEFIKLLPKFTQQPKDKVDIVLWLYINYIRDLKGLPEIEYKEIWEFYEKRREDYEKQELDNDPSMKVEEGEIDE